MDAGGRAPKVGALGDAGAAVAEGLLSKAAYFLTKDSIFRIRASYTSQKNEIKQNSRHTFGTVGFRLFP
jgi:hypothetical protein